MPSYQDIRQVNRLDGTEIMHISDDENHVQFIHVADIEDEEPFVRRCEECFEPHKWRRAWVIA